MSDANQIDALRARAIASMPSKQKLQPQPLGKQPEVEREEGELCSSDDDQVSLSSQPTSERGLPSNNPSLGGYSVLVPQEKILTAGITGASNVLMTEATSSTANANANAIVRKSELLSGLSASTPFTISMKSPKEVEITKFSVASQTLVPTLSADVDIARQQGITVPISEREPITSQVLLHDSVKKLSAAAPAYRATPNGSSVTQPITFGRISGRAGDVAKVPKGTPGSSLISSHRPFSPPFAASHRPFSPVVGARSSSGVRSQPASFPADRAEADKFLASLALPERKTGTNSEFIINFDDSDSDGERVPTQVAQVQSRPDVNRTVTKGNKLVSRTLTANGSSEPNRLRGRKTGMAFEKTTVNAKAGTSVRPASVGKPSPPRPDTQIETLRQLIAAKESQIEQSKRVSQVPDSRSRPAASGLLQAGTQKVVRTVRNSLAVNSASKTLFKKKPRMSNLAHVDPRLTNFQADEAGLSERSREKVAEPVSKKLSSYQVSSVPSEGTASPQQADVVVGGKRGDIQLSTGAKESGISNFRSTEEVANFLPSRGPVVIPAVAAVAPSRTGTPHGTPAAVVTKATSNGGKLVEAARRSNVGVPVIESGLNIPGNGESLKSVSEATGAENTGTKFFDTMLARRQFDQNGTSSALPLSGDRHLEPIRPEQAKGIDLNGQGFAPDYSLELHKKHQLDHRSNVIIQPSARLGSDPACSLLNSSKVADPVAGLSADEVKVPAKRQKRDEYTPQVFNVGEYAAASLPPFSSLPERRSNGESPLPCPPSTDQVQKWRDDSRNRDLSNFPVSASYIRVDDQQSQKRKTLDGIAPLKAVDIPSRSTLKDSSGLHVGNSHVEESQQIRNGENMSVLVNATVSRVLPAQEADNRNVRRMDGGGVSNSSAQPSRDLLNSEIVTTSEAAGNQIMSKVDTKVFPSAINSTHRVQSGGRDKLPLHDNFESAPDPVDPGGYNRWPPLGHFEAGGNHMEKLRMQHTVGGGSADHSLENLRDEEDIVDKDLEEAQVQRRNCEIRERELRRAYRDAQLALNAANARCEALLQRQKFLSVQVQAAELHFCQQPSFTVHSKSLVPFDANKYNTLPKITEVPLPVYPSTVGCVAEPSTDYELEFGRVANGNEGRIISPQVDEHTLKVPSSSADTEILEENLQRTTQHSSRLSGGHIPSAGDARVGDMNALSGRGEAPHSGVRAEGEVSISANTEGATSSQRLKLKNHSETIVSSEAVGQVDLQDLSQGQRAVQNRSSAILDIDASVRGSMDGFHTQCTSPQIREVQAWVAEMEVNKDTHDARETVSIPPETDRGLLEQDETRTTFGNDQICQHITGQEPFEDRGEVTRVSSLSTQEPNTSDKEPSNFLKAPGRDVASENAFGSGTENAFDDVAEQQDKDMMDFEDMQQLQADSRSDGDLTASKHGSQDDVCREHHFDVPAAAGLPISPESRSDGSPNGDLTTSKHDSQDGCRKHILDKPAIAGLTISLKNKREISGLRALAENHVSQHLDRRCEDTSNYNDLGDRVFEDTEVEELNCGSNRSLKQQSLSTAQAKDCEVTGDKGDCASRTSVSSEGESRSLKGEDGREVELGDRTNEDCRMLPHSANTEKNGLDDLADDVTADLHASRDLVGDDPFVDLKFTQLPSTELFVGLADLDSGNSPPLRLPYQVILDKKLDESTFPLASSESPLTIFRSYRMCSAFQSTWHNSLKSETWSHKLDPFQPLCMFEHRGICNNDACPWQHVADYRLDDVDLLSQLSNYVKPMQEDDRQQLSSETICAKLGEIIDGASKNVESIICNKASLPRPFTWNRGSTAPLYKIGPYQINQDESVAPKVNCCLSNQYKCNPYTSFTLSSAVRRPMPSDMPCLPTVSSDIDNQASTPDADGRRYTGERSVTALEEHVCIEPGDIEAWLDLALISIDFDLNCADVVAYNKALFVLSRALEANPTVATLWIFYIGLYYHDKSEIGDDDLFFHAIENSKGSYELLLLYINSRTTIPERMKAYDLALGALINVGEHSQDQSACILDVVLQMVDFICVAKTTHFLPIWVENVVNTSSASVLTCLTPEDCCILMVACAYAVAFAQLPRNCILRLGCRQQLPWNIDWSKLSEVQEGSKDLVLKMMEAGLQCDSVLSQEVSERVMAINYLKCLALYYGSEHALLISRQIMERHPTFIEVILFIVHLEGKKGWKNVFQKALESFTERSSDQQRLWYQYAVHMLSAEGRVGAMNVLRQCAAAACQGSNGWDFIGSDGMVGTEEGLQLHTRKFLKPNESCMIGREAVFSWMNLALYEMLVGNEGEAQIALEKSMKAADIWEDVFHCWKELAAFIRFRKAGQEQATAILDLLDRCTAATNVSHKLVPLASKLLSPISKRRVRVFLESLLGTTYIDHSLMNTVVEVIIGREPRVTKEVAMIVEAVMEIFPRNHELLLQFSRKIHFDNLDRVADISAAVWLSSLVFGSLLQSSPQACEQQWVEAGQLLERLQDRTSLSRLQKCFILGGSFFWRIYQSIEWVPIICTEIRTRRQLTEANVTEAPSTLGAEGTDHVVFVFFHHQALSQMNDYDGLKREEKKFCRLLGNSMVVLRRSI